MITRLAAALALTGTLWLGCGTGGGKPGTTATGSGGAGATTSAVTTGGGAPDAGPDVEPGVGGFNPGGGGSDAGACLDVPPTPAGPEAVLAPAVASLYTVYDLGSVPGMPAGHLGGCVIKYDDPNTLLLAGDSEAMTGGIYSIGLQRGPCGHITGFVGSAVLVAPAPYVDANLIYGPNDVLFYSQWPVNQVSQLLPGQGQAASTIDLGMLGITGAGSVGGLGFVPPDLAAGGQLRALTWSQGFWYHLGMAPAMQTFTLSSPQQTATLANGPGGFAYIPKGSPGFPAPSLIVAEWSVSTVGTYQVDPNGDPMTATRQDFFTTFPQPWGAYFEPQTGDFLFLTWGSLPDKVYVVQGFALPPPPPPPPG